MKKLPLEEKMAKQMEMKKLQQQVTVLHTQHQQRIDKVVELQDKAEIFTGIIHPVHQKVRKAVESIGSIILEHISFDLVENLKKTKEDV